MSSRDQKTQESTLFLRLLLEEELVGLAGQFEQLDAIFDVALVGTLLDRKVMQNAVLLSTPVGGFCTFAGPQTGSQPHFFDRVADEATS
jgi:hypothetical protein